MTNSVTAIIFGFNSSPRIESVLIELSKQKIPSNVSYEIILMNNASSDDTVIKAAAIWEKLNLSIPLRIIEEDKAGLVYSRETAIINSKSDILVFVDDDNILEHDYIFNSIELMNSLLSVGVIGGEITPCYEINPPSWFSEFNYSLAVGKQNDSEGEIPTKKGFVWGAGLVIRKSVLNKLYDAGFKFSKRIYKNKLIGYADDYELCLFVQLAGYKIYYSEKLKLKHIIASNKLNFKALKNNFFKHGYSSILADSMLLVIDNKSHNINIRMIYFKHVLNCIKNISLFLLKRTFYFSRKNILYYNYNSGRLVHLLYSFNYYQFRFKEVMKITENLKINSNKK